MRKWIYKVVCTALVGCVLFVAGAVERQNPQMRGVVVEAGKGTPLTGAVVLYVPAGQEGTEYALTDGQGRFGLQVSGMPAAGDSLRVSMLGYATVTLALVAGDDGGGDAAVKRIVGESGETGAGRTGKDRLEGDGTVGSRSGVTDWRNIRVELQTQALVLNEVFVRAPKVNLFGDTVEYNVQSFVEQQDKSISDVLKRMPGVEVREGGDIYYNARPRT